FVLAPMERKEQLKPLLATFFSELLFTSLAVAKTEPGARLRRPTWFLLDEFCNIGQIPNFANFLTVSRGHGIGLVLGVQSRSQLADVYGEEDAQTIENACATYLVYPRIGPDDAEWLSRILGETTVVTSSRSWEPGDLFAKRSQSESRRRLMTADEIRALEKDHIFVLAGTRRPVLLKQCRWYQQPQWQHIQPAELEEFA
ncbi:MAG: type IV secretory system conjugative DNA transfer family protein, partial [Thermoleophilia bacterium]|nr:type IV secretory system conjugative DNA transfer family protein [Thermoleophilia bacterium]